MSQGQKSGTLLRMSLTFLSVYDSDSHAADLPSSHAYLPFSVCLYIELLDDRQLLPLRARASYSHPGQVSPVWLECPCGLSHLSIISKAKRKLNLQDMLRCTHKAI